MGNWVGVKYIVVNGGRDGEVGDGANSCSGGYVGFWDKSFRVCICDSHESMHASSVHCWM